MNKKNGLVNLLMLCIFIVLILTAIFFFTKIPDKNKENTNTTVVLKEVTYDSEVTALSFNSEDALINLFIEGYNNSEGAKVAQLMNFPAMYIYSGCENKSDFDKEYEETLGNDIPADELILMQYSLKQQETALISGINGNKVQLTLVENSNFQDTSKYLSKMTAKIRTVSEADGIDEVDTLEFILLKRDGHYSIIEYNLIESEPANK